MRTLIFLLTILSLLILLVSLIVRTLRRKSIKQILKVLILTVASYSMVWFAFYLKSTYIIVPLNTDICFDDWCATVAQIEKGPDIQKQSTASATDSTLVVLDIKMSNHARGIAQKPSEPRVFLIDGNGNKYNYSVKGQQLLEKLTGKLPDLDQRLELNESVKTRLVYTVPQGKNGLKISIEEGPFIIRLLFPEDKLVFNLKLTGIF